jgi:hypothetical protein
MVDLSLRTLPLRGIGEKYGRALDVEVAPIRAFGL